jgi:hypothetical protein
MRFSGFVRRRIGGSLESAAPGMAVVSSSTVSTGKGIEVVLNTEWLTIQAHKEKSRLELVEDEWLLLKFLQFIPLPPVLIRAPRAGRRLA